MKKILASLLLMVFIAPLALQAEEVKSRFFYDFNGNSIEGWKTTDRDNDGNNWLVSEEGYIYSESSESIKPNNIIATVEKYAIYATSKITFDVRVSEDKSLEKYGIGVAYSLDGEYFTTLQDETALTSATEWNTVEISLDYIANQEVYIGILHNVYDNQGTVMVDNVKLTDGLLNTVTDVVAEENDDNVNITWNAPAEDNANVFYGYRLFRARGEENPVMLADNLTETSYQDAEWKDIQWGIYKYGVAALYQQKTRGNADTILVEGFETTEYPNIPEGWTKFADPVSSSVSAPWVVTTSELNPVVSPYTGEKYAYSSFGNKDNTEYYFVTPAIDLTKAVNPTLTFNYIAKGFFDEPGNPLSIRFSESATGPWTEIFTDQANEVWKGATVNLNDCSGKVVYLAFVHKDTEVVMNYGVGLDDVCITAQVSENIVPVASKIVWSNELEKDMNTTVNVSVVADDNSSVEGAIVTLNNINETTYTYEGTIDENGACQLNVRRGTYKYTVSLDEYYTTTGEIEIYEETSLGCILEKKPELIEGLYVSPTGWAMWEYEEENITYDVMFDGITVAQNITDKYFQFDVTALVEGEEYTTTVFPKGQAGSVMMEYTWTYTSCGDFANAVNFRANKEDGKAVLSWTMPTVEVEPEAVATFSTNFDNGSLEGWTTIDADGDNRNWQNTSEFATQGFGVENTFCAASLSYEVESDKAIDPNNFLVTGQKCAITASSKLTYSVSAQSKLSPNEHYGIAISTKSNTNAEDFEVIFDETLTAGEVDSTSTQGQWFERTVDLSTYAGQDVYIAIRHYNSKDNSWLKVDNISLTNGATRGTTEGGGEWLYYDNGAFESAINNFDMSNNPTQIFWAIMFPSDVIADYAKRNITKVAMYDYTAHKGAFSIHKGGDDAPGEMVHVQSYETTGQKAYIEIELDSPVTISGKDNIWIQFSNEYGSGVYPAAYSADMGDPNSRWRSDDGSMWYDSEWFGEGWYGTWMIRAYVDEKDESVLDDPEVATAEPIGTIIFRNGELITPEPIKDTVYTDSIFEGEEEIEYTIRVVYGGEKDKSYYAMSCPTTKVLKTIDPLVCVQPKGLYGETTLNKNGSFGATLVWPYMEKEWLYYDDGKVLETSIGTGGAIQWGVMFPAKDLAQYASGYINKVSLFDIEACDATLNIAYGGDFAPGLTVHSQNFKFEGKKDYLELDLTAQIPVTGEENVWITIKTTAQYPAAVTSITDDPNGRWCSVDGASWGDITTMGNGLDYSWYLRACISNEPNRGDEGTFDHYNVYRSTTNGNYQWIGETTGNRYFDEVERGTYYYQVTSVYTRGEETCESEPATTHEDENVNYVVVEVTAIDENGVKGVMAYPNPAKDLLNISAENMKRITINNVLGQVVYDKQVDSDNEIIDMSQYEAGIYMVRIATENGVAVKRISLTK